MNGDFQTNSTYGCNAGPNWNFDSDPTNLPEITDIFQSGNWWIDLTPCGDFGNGTWIEQEVTTIPGTCYTVTMDIASYCGWDGSDSGINLTADGVAVGDRIFNDVFSCIAGTLGWGTFTSEVFVATGNTTILRFTGEGRCSSISDPLLCAPLGGVGNPGVIGLDNIFLNSINVDPITLDPFPDATRCPGQTLTLGQSFAGAQYVWNTGATSSQITVQNAGTYIVTISNTCTSISDTIIVTDGQIPPPIYLGPDHYFCDDFSVTLYAGSTPAIWSTQEIGTSIQVTSPGLYTASITNTCGSSSDTVELVLNIVPVSQTFDVVLCENESVILSVDNEDHLWSNGETSSFITVTEAGTYTVDVSNNCGEAVYTYTVIFDPCSFDFFAPNSYTPNGDGVNDVWHPVLSGTVDKIEVTIWNRWGEKIWSTNEAEINWTGQVDSGQYYVQDGIYEYLALVTLKSEITTLKGHIVVMR